MINCDVIYLISETPEAHGIFSAPTEAERMVFCEVNSVSRYEFWRAKENGNFPAYVFRLSDRLEYQGEKILKYNGDRYRVVRTYVDGYAIEITAEPATIDRDPPPAPTPTQPEAQTEEAAADG